MAVLNTSEKNTTNGVKKMNTSVDLTAMVDLAFLLITFFMLTTTLAKPVAMEIFMPVGTEPRPVKQSSTLTLCLGNQDQLLWYRGTNENPEEYAIVNYGKRGVRELLLHQSREVLRNTGKQLMVLIKPSDHARYQNLVDVIDELSITKVSSYAIASISKEDVNRLKAKGIY